MAETVVALPTFDALCRFVRLALCEQDALAVEQTPFVRTPLVAGGNRRWGYVFHVEGPRRLRTSAVWAAAADRIAFYDSTGRRVREVRLSEAPDPPSAVRPAA
jgi:hypothetical protein